MSPKSVTFIPQNLLRMSIQSYAPIKGVNFVVDGDGKPVSIVLDINQHGALIEEFFDVVISKERLANEPTVSFDELKKELQDEQKLD